MSTSEMVTSGFAMIVRPIREIYSGAGGSRRRPPVPLGGLWQHPPFLGRQEGSVEDVRRSNLARQAHGDLEIVNRLGQLAFVDAAKAVLDHIGRPDILRIRH